MHRIFCRVKDISDDKIFIYSPPQIHHIKDILRLKRSEKIVVCDESGCEYDSVIQELSAKKLILTINAKRPPHPADKITITFACAIPKKTRFDDIVDKLTQLGVDTIIPLETERMIVRLDKKKEGFRLNRWRKIALNASMQSQRTTIAVIEPVKKIQQVVNEFQDYDLKLIPTLITGRKSLKEVFLSIKPKRICILIGPEGDFTPEEVGLAKAKGFIPVTLGESVLRVETAAVSLASILNYVFKNY